MNNLQITTQELDAIARPGLEDIRQALGVNPPEGAWKRAEFTLKIIRSSTARMSAENNQIGMMVKLARAAGLTPAEFRPIWEDYRVRTRQTAASGDAGA